MAKRHKPEEIIAKLRQVEVMTGQGTSMADAIRSIGGIRSMNDICRRSIEREMLSPEFYGRARRDGSETAAWDDGGATAVG